MHKFFVDNNCNRILKVLSPLIGFVSLLAHGTIISSTNAPTDVWAVAGVPGGIPTRTTIHATLNPGASSDAIISAINSCPPNQVVYLNAGTYNIANMTINRPDYWTLRGAGMGKTILNINGGAQQLVLGTYPPWGGTYANTVDINSGGSQGGTNLVVADVSGYSVGDLCVIDMNNSGWIVGFGQGGDGQARYNWDSAGKLRDGNRVQLHIVQVRAKSGSTLTFWPPLPFALDFTRTPQISRMGNARGPQWSGIEDMTINANGASSAGICPQGTYAFWLKNVEVTHWGTFGVWPRWSACFEMRGCYVHEPNKYDWSKGYALQLDPCSGSLIIDNIFYKNQDTVLLQGGCAGNVLAYNACYQSYNGYIGVRWLLQTMAANHTPFPCYNLFEGNYTAKYQPDYYYGPSGFGVVFRNRITGNDPEISSTVADKGNRYPISIDAQQRYYSVVGNQLGELTAPTSVYLAKPNITLSYAQPGTLVWGYNPGSYNFGYQSNVIFRLGYPNSGNNGASGGLSVHDNFVKTNTLIHGNWDASHNAVTWDSAIADQNIPNSLFLSAKPAFFGDLAWPPYGPSAPSSVTGDLAKIPAGYRLLHGVNPPTGSSDQPPVPKATALPLQGSIPLTVSFSGESSFDPEGKPLTFSWTFGDGATSTLAVPTHIYDTVGSYTVNLTVSDGANTDSTSINIEAQTPNNGLVAAYGFNEGQGSIIRDSSPNGNNGTAFAGKWAPGKTGSALTFNGSNTVVTVPDSPSLDLSTMTLEAWVYPTSLGTDMNIVYKDNFSYALAGSGVDSNSPAVGGSFSNPLLYGPAPLATNTWSHVAATYDGLSLRLYVNAVEVSNMPQNKPVSITPGMLMIGGNSLVPGKGWFGKIDEVRVYNRALSTSEIEADKGTIPPPPPPQNLRAKNP